MERTVTMAFQRIPHNPGGPQFSTNADNPVVSVEKTGQGLKTITFADGSFLTVSSADERYSRDE
jgi:hypothetical protein